MITDHWDVDFFILFFLAIFLWTVGEIVWAWWKDRRRWRAVKPYYGRPYDASTNHYRPNVDLRRTR